MLAEKWYEVARSREKCLIKKLDVYMHLSMTHDNAFDLLYVSIDEINRRLTKCYHGKFVVKSKNDYLIIRHGLWWKKFIIIAKDEDKNIVALSNRWKSKLWILARKLPYDKAAFDEVVRLVVKQGFDKNNIEFFYD